MMELTKKQIDSLRELMNIGVGKGASILNTMLNSHIILEIPSIEILSAKELVRKMDTISKGMLSTVNLQFKGYLTGTSKLIFPSESAQKLVKLMIDDFDSSNDTDLDSITAGTLSEIGNILLNSVIGTMCNYFKISLDFSVPYYTEGSSKKIISYDEDLINQSILLARTRFNIEKMDIDGDIVLLFRIGSFENLIEKIDALGDEDLSKI